MSIFTARNTARLIVTAAREPVNGCARFTITDAATDIVFVKNAGWPEAYRFLSGVGALRIDAVDIALRSALSALTSMVAA